MPIEELKPCPHCGHAAMWVNGVTSGVAIVCGGAPRCRASVGLYGGGCFDTEAKAIEAWNARHPTPTAADTGLVERLTAELERTKQQRQMLQGNVEDLERSAEQREAALLKMHASLAEDRKSAIDALMASEQREAAARAERDRLIANPGAERYWEGRWRDADAELTAAREQIAALEREVWRLQSKLSEVFDYDARDSAK